MKPIRVIKRTSKLWKLWNFWFPGADLTRMYLAFGDTIFTPEEGCPEDLMVHELVHLEQHKFSRLYAIWWHLKYRASAKFRYSQEVPAYQAQMRWANRQNWDFRKKYLYRKGLADNLSGKLYGNLTTKTEAFEVIGEKTQ